MEKSIIEGLTQSFKLVTQEAEGIEFMFARDLQTLLGYSEWRNFNQVIDKAKIACHNSGHNCDNHFVEVNKMVERFQ